MRGEGETCGSFFGTTANNNAGSCAKGLICNKDPRVADAPGKCERGSGGKGIQYEDR